MDVFERNPLENQHQFLSGDFDVICRFLYFRHLKRALLEPFVPDGKTGLIPHQYLDQGSGPVNKYEYVSRKWVLTQLIDHQSAQSIEAFSHISRLTIQEEPAVAGKSEQHGRRLIDPDKNTTGKFDLHFWNRQGAHWLRADPKRCKSQVRDFGLVEFLNPISEGAQLNAILLAKLPLAYSALLPLFNHLRHPFAVALALHKTFLCKATPSACSGQDGLVGWIQRVQVRTLVEHTENGEMKVIYPVNEVK